MAYFGSKLMGLPGLIRNLSSSVTDIWGYFANNEVSDGDELSDTLEQGLLPLYGDCTQIAVKQAKGKLYTGYHGDINRFLTEFFYPAVNLLVRLKKENGIPGCTGKERSWPLTCRNAVLVNLCQIPPEKLHFGDFYFSIGQSQNGQLQLVVNYISHGSVREKAISEGDFSRIFTMDWKGKIRTNSNEELGKLLKQCIVSLEESIEKLQWEDVIGGDFTESSSQPSGQGCSHGNDTKIPGQGHSNNSNSSKIVNNSSQNHSSGSDNLKHSGQGHSHGDDRNSEDARNNNASVESKGNNLHKTDSSRPLSMESSDGREVDKPRCPRSPGLHQHRHLDMPKTILDVDYNLLSSGVAILPGCRDSDGNAIVFIFTSSSLWKNQQVRSSDLARLLMYYQSVPRESLRCRGITVVADIRGTTASTINTLLESLYLFEGNLPRAISIVHLLSDKVTQSLVLKSPIYDIHASFQIDLLMSLELLYTYIAQEQLPPVLEGYFQYSHEDWIRFHMRMDPFVSNCRAIAKYLVSVMQELAAIESLPKSSSEASHLIDHHENLIKSAFEDPRLVRLQNEGEAILQSLEREERHLHNSDDYRYAMEDVRRLYKHLQDTVMKLVRLSDMRLVKLEQCMQLKEFEEECGKIITWVQNQGSEFLQRHLLMADNLKAVRSQQKEFEKFYFSAMTHIEKGNDLLEEASMLAQSGNFEEVTGYKELARTLKLHLHRFTEKLEESRDRIENTTKCYHLLDKTYEWALEAMKYVASMKMEHCASPEGLQKLLHSLDLYLRDHPPIKQETFNGMFDIAQKLRNDKLLEQCQTAKNRCEETEKMLTLRQNTLQQAKDQLENEQKNMSRTSANSSVQSRSQAYYPEPKKSEEPEFRRPTWQPRTTSTPVGPKIPPRGHTDRNSAEMFHTPTNQSSVHYLHPQRRDPSGYQQGPSPHSKHISSSASPIAGNLNDSEMKSPLSDLSVNSRTSKENVLGFHESPNSNLDLQSQRLADTNSSNLPQGSTSSSRNRPAKKVLKRATTAPIPGANPVIMEEDPTFVESSRGRINNLRQNGRTDSMITGSTDSLPSLPEEDEGVVTNLDEFPRREWTPVPVNSHLSEYSSNVPTAPLADLKLSETEIKSRRTLALVMSEMVQTERDYVCSLRFIIENYIPEMQREDVPQALRGKRNIIFGNIEKIYQFHQQYFLQEVDASRRNPFQIARYFLMHESQFFLYALYNKNKLKSDALMAEYGKYFFQQKQRELGDKMDLSSYLLKPVQRMGKYALLLKQILKECPKQNQQEQQELKAAEEMVKFHLRHGNDLLAVDALKDCDVNIAEQGRLLRQNEFLVWQGRRKSMRHVFIFEDLILFSKTKRGRHGEQDTYTYKSSFKMADMGLTENYGESGYKFEIWFRRRSIGENYVLQAPNSEVKKAWTKEITRLLWNQALKNRENRLSELATMGIGNKPCLDLKPSENNIQDRFINIAVGPREARTRNSIAVCSSEHMYGNKRPHSIISVGSSSSSNSSQSGPGYISSMNLAFDPLDSPQSYRKSLTFMSSESGIGTDISSTDMDSTLKYDQSDLNLSQSPRRYSEFSKPKIVLMAPCCEESTDV